jgi:GNAT superfamily N-acetyltransferase
MHLGRSRTWVRRRVVIEPKGLQEVSSEFTSGAGALDRRLQEYVRRVAVKGRDVERVGPFTATFDPRSANRYLSYAFPDANATPTVEDVEALIAAYRRRDRVPRLEFLPAVAPEVAAALTRGGFTVEGELAVMTCGAPDVVALPAPDGIVIETPVTDDDMRGMRLAQHRAFGVQEPEVDDAEVTRQRASQDEGALAFLARDAATGAVVGGGVATVPADGVTEIAGIGVLESHRRRGIAGAITAALTTAAIAAGVELAWLTPGDDDAHRVYARAGFRDKSNMLHMVLPD